ncbi:retrovirus-related pol polyprotein from transposon TNT 1-94 [Tanacetum coccineum]
MTNSMSLIGESVNMDGKRKESCNLEAELLKLQNAFNDLLKSYSQLEKHCISLELSIQLNQEIFQKDESCNNQNALEIPEFFENNDLKAQLQDKDNTICKLKDIIKSMREKSKEENVKYDYCEIETKNIELKNNSMGNVKKDIDEIETINVELEHSVAKLLLENENLRKEREHLKSIFKDQFGSIGKTRVQSKEHCDSLIAQINTKSVENSDLNAHLQEKVFAITTFKNELRKLKGKNVINNAVSKPNVTIAPGMFKLDIEALSLSLKNNRDAHAVYIKKTIEYTDTLRGFVESARTQNPRVKPTTSASGSKPLGNTKNNRITRPPHSNQKNKVEDQSRKVKSSLNKMNSVFEPISNALVKHSVRNAKFKSKCAICCPDCPLVSGLQMFKTYDRETLSAHELWEHNYLKGSRDINLYTISVDDMLKTSPICLLSKASKTKSWLWHSRLSHLNFDTLNKLAKDGLARGPGLQVITPATSSSGLVPTIIPQQPCNPPKRDDWDTLFQPLFDEYFNHPTIVVSIVPVAVAPRAIEIADSPVSMSIDQDAPSSKDSTSQGSSSNVRPSDTPFELISRWTKYHPIANVIGDPSRSVSTRKQLKTNAMWCYFDAFLTSVEPKNFKQAMTEPSWIDAMQEEIHEFKRLQVRELVPFRGENQFRGIICTGCKNIDHPYLGSKFSQQEYEDLPNGRQNGFLKWRAQGRDTPMVEKNKLDEDLQWTPIDATLYRGMIGSLMYLTSSRPDLIYTVCLCAWYQAKPTEKHLNAMRSQLTDYGFQFNTIPLSCDNKSAIALCCNNVQHSRANDIDERYHFIKEQVENGIAELYFVRTKYQLADIFTKPFPRERFNFLIEKVGMRSMSPEMLKRLIKEEDEIINPQETQQVAARDEKWVPSAERVKISSTNIILETIVLQKEETFQVVIDIIKNSTCFKAFTISADVLEIFMQQFRYTIKKVPDTDSYEFLLANKKCTVNAKVFKTILDICPRVEGVDFADVPDDNTTLTFLIDLGYKGPLNRHTNMFVDHMHQPWRTLAAIINKCLSRKTASNDKL